jgi:hypothetical protein
MMRAAQRLQRGDATGALQDVEAVIAREPQQLARPTRCAAPSA